ncbi:MAG: tetratricopeptide repeat protein [Phototrophicaceae bacterium]
MYIRTPKRYRGSQRRQVFSCQRFLLLLILVILIIAGVGIYEMRDALQPNVSVIVNNGMEQVNAWQSTQFAPTVEPTRDPSSVLIDADNEWQAGRIGFALNSYRQVINSLPNDVDVYMRLSEGYLTRGNITDAFEYADATVTANPFSADAWATRSLIHSWNGDFADGIANAQQALAIDPDNARATAYLAYAYFQAGQGELARSRAEDAIQLDPNQWAGYWMRGLVQENILPIDYIAAQTDFETAYNIARIQNPAMAGIAGSALGRVVNALGNPQRAVELYNEMLTIDNGNREVLYYLGITHFRDLGEWADAQEIFTDCVDIAPEDASCWYFLGRSRNSLGDQDGAIIALEEAIDLNTSSARHYWWLASILRNSRSCAAATEYLEIGYDMVIEGGLPAVDEGNVDLIADFEFELNICRISIVPNTVPIQPTPETTQETGDA